jgi:hemolysin-activating ACP:hemolysin acyltransferase
MKSRTEFSEAGSSDSDAAGGVRSRPSSPKAPEAAAAHDENAAGMQPGSPRILSTVGQIVVLLMRSQAYQNATLGDLKPRIMPPIIAGQYSIAGKRGDADGLVVPVGGLLWARVSAGVDARLSADPTAPLKFSPVEWTGGDIIWITEAVGEAPIIKEMMGRLLGGTWEGRTVRQQLKGDRGMLVFTHATA